jgi:hypothetical protein
MKLLQLQGLYSEKSDREKHRQLAGKVKKKAVLMSSFKEIFQHLGPKGKTLKLESA